MLSQITVNIRLVEKLLSDDEDEDEFTDHESQNGMRGKHSVRNQRLTGFQL